MAKHTKAETDVNFPDKTFALDTSPRAVSLFPFYYEIGGSKTLDHDGDSDDESSEILLPKPLVGSYYGISISK